MMKLTAEINGKKQEYVLNEGSNIVGRDLSCDITLPAGSVSRRHADLRVEGGKIIVRDLGSKNGTFVRGERIQTAEIEPGDKLNIGYVLVEFSAEAPSQAAPPPVFKGAANEDEFDVPQEEGYAEDSSPTPIDDSFAPVSPEGGQGQQPAEERLPARVDVQTPSPDEAEPPAAIPAAKRRLTRREKMMFLLPAVALVIIFLLATIISGLRSGGEEKVLSRGDFNRHIDGAVKDFQDGNTERSLESLKLMSEYKIEGDPQTHRLLLRAIEMDMNLHTPESFDANWRRARELWEDVQAYNLATENARALATDRISWIARESRNMALYKRLAEELEGNKTDEALTLAAEIPRDSMFFALAHEKAEGLRQQVIDELVRQGLTAENARNWDKAIELYDRAIYLSPTPVERAVQGIANSRKFKDEESRINQARGLIDQGRIQEAERLLVDIDRQGPYNAVAQDLRLQAATHQERQKAVSLYNDGKAAEAMKVLEEAGLGNSELYRKMRMVKERWEEAERAIAQADFTTARAACQTIVNLESAENNRYRVDARQFLTAWRDRARDMALARRDEGVRSLDAGRLSEARDKFEEAIRLDPDGRIGRAEIDSLKREAVNRYNIALNLEARDPQRALQIYKDIRDSLRIGDPYYERALEAIDRMSNK